MSGWVHQLPMGASVTRCGLYFLPKEVKASAPPGVVTNPDGLPRMSIDDGWKRNRDAEALVFVFYGTNRTTNECPACFP